MLQKELRLNLKVDFKRVAAGRKAETNFVKLFILNRQDSRKLGIAVPSKVFKKANLRNRVRRIVSKAFESIFPLLPEDIHILVLPKASALEVKSFDIEADLRKYFSI